MSRFLTLGEVHLLGPVFGNTLNYRRIRCDINKADVGGKGNSITPAGIAYMSRNYYCGDFAAKDVDAIAQWVFVHEMGHVWQWQHGRYPVNEAIGVYISKAGKYEQAYPYDLEPGKDLLDYNFEQQAAIIADYWALLTKKLQPQYNRGQAKLADYSTVISQLRSSGQPVPQLDRIPI